MNILIIDGQGGKIGSKLVEEICRVCPDADITAVGTNSAATQNMLKAGAARGATGENAVIVGCRRASVILGPVGIVIADSLCGEITPAMAQAVGQSEAKRILLPLSKCDTLIAGIGELPIGALVEDAVKKLEELTVNE